MKNSQLQKQLKKHFSGQNLITTKEIIEFLSSIHPGLTSNTISWKLNQLKRERLIFQTGRGLYSFEYKPDYTPDLSLKAKRLYNRIKTIYEGDVSIWDTQILNNIAETNIIRHWTFISVIREDMESLFENMLNFSKQTFIQPDKEITNRYLMAHNEAIIITPLISETPLYKSGDYLTPTLEGLLVNTWLEYEAYLQPIGFDINTIFEQALKKYNVNQSKLLRYASRRDRRDIIKQLIKSKA